MMQANFQAKQSTEDELRSEWGQEYRGNVEGLDSLLRHAGEAVAGALLDARTADGVQILNQPDVVRWLAGHARTLGFIGATVVPPGGDIGKSMDDEIKAITVEDPVEYRFIADKSIISQREIGIDVDSFSSALKYVVRQDPDVIFIGEMR
ncbi:MAG TPA: hypothetical protein DCZ11_08820, partial [Gammaproteobacteria bacterium]|nr:hypothetical protein [Gammaproteobacteria bacterium]MCH78532.1 hypothetical protein [Gammaproteobacteria bacterium]